MEKKWKAEKFESDSFKEQLKLAQTQIKTLKNHDTEKGGQVKSYEERLQELNKTIEEKSSVIDSLKTELEQSKVLVSKLQTETEQQGEQLKRYQNGLRSLSTNTSSDVFSGPKHDFWHNQTKLLVVIDAAGVGSSKDVEVSIQGNQLKANWIVGTFEKKNLFDKFTPLTFNRIHPEKILQTVNVNLTLPCAVDTEKVHKQIVSNV